LESSELLRTQDWVRDQDVVETRLHHDLGLADLGARDSRRTTVNLKPSDLRHLVGLGVGPQTHPGVATSLSHFRDIGFDAIQINDERRCIKVKDVHGCTSTFTGFV
jgi:hypothetical protein